MTTYSVRIESERPIIIQSDRLADPLDPISKEKTRLAKHKDKKTDEYQEKIGKLEWFGSLYLDDDGAPAMVIPCDNIIRAMRDAAARERFGKDVYSEITVDPPLIPIEHSGPKNIESMYAFETGGRRPFVFRKTVAQQKARVVRVRPRIDKWALEFEVTVGGSKTLDGEAVKRFLEVAGMTGIGTWRPRYGHFRVVKFKKV